MKKKLLIITICLILVTGCNNMTNISIDDTVNIMLSKDQNLFNKVYDGYKYYLQKGLRLINKDEYNATIIDDNNNTYYFYIDIISYYNKTKLKYKNNKDAYYSKKINYNNKEGYLEITKMNKESKDLYFIEYMYNYGKIEAFVKEKDLKNAIINMSSILKSLKFNDDVIESIIGNNVLNYKENTFDVMKPKGSKATKNTYLEYEEKYGIYEGYNIDKAEEDKIEIDED